jgi:glycine cleavage system H lipoate-binding protein
MVSEAVPRTDETCVWVTAGVLTYKLCDRGFDCEHCPLDAALHGCPLASALRSEAAPVTGHRFARFPADRLYSTGHTWVRPLEGDDGRVRLGLDSFAVTLVARPRHLRRDPVDGILHRGEPLCQLESDLGELSLATPVVAEVRRWNRALADDAALLVEAPYTEGWIVELALAGTSELGDLLRADDARDQARLDARRFRRRLALQLLADERPAEIPPAGGADPPGADLREILGGRRYLALVQELIH